MGDFDFATVFSYLASGFMMFGGAIPYAPQYLEIRRSRNADGFSLYVCLTLLVANILRINFWFGHPFESPLLIQSIVMILTMFAMIHICTQTKEQSSIIPSKQQRFIDTPDKTIDIEKENSESNVIEQRVFTDFNLRFFWNWTHFSSYVQCTAMFALVTSFFTYAFLQAELGVFFEAVGFVSLFTEALLGLPQFLKNWKNASTRGMSVSMVLLWTAGDLFKTMYFIVKSTPIQFWMCGMLQVSLDFCILTQVVYYRDKHKI